MWQTNDFWLLLSSFSETDRKLMPASICMKAFKINKAWAGRQLIPTDIETVLKEWKELMLQIYLPTGRLLQGITKSWKRQENIA